VNKPYPATIGAIPTRQCLRCGAEVYLSAEVQPHLCKDKAARLKRQQAQYDAVIDILLKHGIAPAGADDRRAVGLDIVGALNRLGVTSDM